MHQTVSIIFKEKIIKHRGRKCCCICRDSGTMNLYVVLKNIADININFKVHKQNMPRPKIKCAFLLLENLMKEYDIQFPIDPPSIPNTRKLEKPTFSVHINYKSNNIPSKSFFIIFDDLNIRSLCSNYDPRCSNWATVGLGVLDIYIGTNREKYFKIFSKTITPLKLKLA